MSNLIQLSQKRVYANLPQDSGYGQYNYGRVESADTFQRMGAPGSSTSNHLYTKVYPYANDNLDDYPNGYFFTGDCKLEITSMNTEDLGSQVTKYWNGSSNNYFETDWISRYGQYKNVKFATYVLDGASSRGNQAASANSGQTLMNILGSTTSTGSNASHTGWERTSRYGSTTYRHTGRISYWNKDTQLAGQVVNASKTTYDYETGQGFTLIPHSVGNVIAEDLSKPISSTAGWVQSGDDSDYDGIPDHYVGFPNWTGLNKVTDIGGEAAKYYDGGTNHSFSSQTAFEDSAGFIQQLLSPNSSTNASHIYVFGRAGGDTVIQTGHWPTQNLDTTWKTDKRDSVYVKMKIAKADLAEAFINATGETITFSREFDNSMINNQNHSRGNLGSYSDKPYRDNQGNVNPSGQHVHLYNLNYPINNPMPGDSNPVNTISSMEVKVTAPEYTIEKAFEAKSTGGYESNWVEKDHICNPIDDLEPYGQDLWGQAGEGGVYNLVAVCNGSGTCSESDVSGNNPNCPDGSLGNIIPTNTLCTIDNIESLIQPYEPEQDVCGDGGQCIPIPDPIAIGSPSNGCECTTEDWDTNSYGCSTYDVYGSGARPLSFEEQLAQAEATNGGWVDVNPKIAIGKKVERPGWWCLDQNRSDAGFAQLAGDGYQTVLRAGLHPRYKMDFMGWPRNQCVGGDLDTNQVCDDIFNEEECEEATYTDNVRDLQVRCRWLNFYHEPSPEGNWFKSDLINQNSRPISSASGSFGVDVQNYYSNPSVKSFRLRALTSAPNNVYVGFRLANSHYDAIPQDIDYIDSGVEKDEPPTGVYKFKEEQKHEGALDWWYFILDWDRTTGESHTRAQHMNDFPTSLTDLQGKQFAGTWGIKRLNEISSHQYLTAGRKRIHAMVFSTVKNYFKDGDGNLKYPGYVQALNWKLVQMYVYINSESIGSMMPRDFEDVGGDNFVYIPYPELIALNAHYHDGRKLHGFAPSQNTYKSSHIVISGLSSHSSYMNSLIKVLKEDKFSDTEITEKSFAQRARELGPKGVLNEVGDFLGKSDISQIRMFNKSMIIEGEGTDNPFYKQIDMNTLLGIERKVSVDGDGLPVTVFGNWDGIDEYNNYDMNFPGARWDCSDWNGERNNCFPLESPVGDIFIDDYNQFKNLCLFEVQCDKLVEKSFRDSAGKSCKGHLIGDYSIKKTAVDSAASRDSHIKVGKTQTANIYKKNGAF